MKVYNTSQIRNIALVGGNKAGKTSLAEAMAFNSGIVTRRGTIEDGNTLSDYREIEIERKGSVVSTVLYAECGDKKLNIIDVPGFTDLQGELMSALPVSETAVVVINAQAGVEVGTEVALRYTAELNTPMIFAINQLDAEKANFDDQIRSLQEECGEKITVVQYPVNAGIGFDSFVDLITQKLYKYPKGGGKAQIEDIPASEQAKAEDLRLKLVENAATGDDELMEKYFDEGDLPIEDVRKGLKKGLASRAVYPVVCVSAKENIGVERMMEFICNNVPAPNEAVATLTYKDGNKATYNASGDTVLYAFKSANESHVGEITFMKVMEGEVAASADVVNSTDSSKERLSALSANAGKNRTTIDKAVAGDIFSTIKLKAVKVGDTLTSAKNQGVSVVPAVYPDPIYSTAIKAVESTDEEKLGQALNDYTAHDPTLRYEIARESKQTIVKGMGEFHINILKWYLDNVYKVATEFYAQKIPYRETITKEAEASYRHKKQSGGSGQFAEVHLYIQPYTEGMAKQTKYPIRGTEEHELPWGGKLIFNNCIVGGAIDARFMPAILKGIMEKMEEGPLTGSYARDIVVNVFDGKMHPVDSNEMAFKLAGRNAFKDAFKNAGPKILEPIYDLSVNVPADLMGGVMTDLQGRRAIVMGMDSEGNRQIIKAKAPLAEMNRYSTSLSSLTSGRGVFSMKYSEYQAVPSDVQGELLKAYEEQSKDEE
ncbi:MAG: elongation factor G [Bacteroidales bacterium]|nr:elongation factor G [Candidatus Scybalousia scybalohippi]